MYRTFLIYIHIAQSSVAARLGTVDGPGGTADEGAVVVAATKRLPDVKASVNGVVVAEVAVSDNGGLGDAVVLDGDGLATKLVVLGSAVAIKDVGGHGDK